MTEPNFKEVKSMFDTMCKYSDQNDIYIVLREALETTLAEKPPKTKVMFVGWLIKTDDLVIKAKVENALDRLYALYLRTDYPLALVINKIREDLT